MSWNEDEPIYNQLDLEIREQIRENAKKWGGYKTKKIITQEEWAEKRRLGLSCEDCITLENWRASNFTRAHQKAQERLKFLIEDPKS